MTLAGAVASSLEIAIALGPSKCSSKAGVVEGTLYDVNALNELAKIPSRDVLISKLLGSLQSPITNLARVLNQIAEQGGAEACEAAPAAEEAATEE